MMRVAFMGTPEFAVPPLEALVDSPYRPIAVVTQPDRANRRGGASAPSPAKSAALKAGLPVYQFESVSRDGAETLASLRPDAMITCAYGQILRQNILDICPVYNIHASLLPKYRGPAPVQYALLNGESVIGATIMRTELGIDSGDILLQASIELTGAENAGEALARVSALGAKLILEVLKMHEMGTLNPIKQNEAEATRTHFFTKADGRLDFTRDADSVVNRVRAAAPKPGAYALTELGVLKVLKAERMDCAIPGVPGEAILADPKRGLAVRCGRGAARLTLVQRENGRPIDARDFLMATKIRPGFRFG